MEVLRLILHIWLATLAWMAGLGVLFTVLSRFFPCNPGMQWWKDRRSVMLDMIFWFVIPLLLRFLRIGMLLAGATLVFWYHDPQDVERYITEGYGPLKALPLWLQMVLILVLSDIMLYGIHRFFHTRHVWRFHAIHHAPKTLDWTITQRFHPINMLFYSVLVDVIILLMGFSPEAMALLVPFNIFFSAFVHANLNWTLGPLRYVLASPVFHRWHHTGVREGGNRNFAPTFPMLDILFGTFYMPKDRLPQDYGVTDPHFPEGFWAQMLYPFRKH